MSLPKSKRTELSKWAALLEKELASREILPPGEGWVTFPELKAELGIGAHRTYKYIERLKNLKKIDVFEGHVLQGNKLKRRVWYRLKD